MKTGSETGLYRKVLENVTGAKWRRNILGRSGPREDNLEVSCNFQHILFHGRNLCMQCAYLCVVNQSKCMQPRFFFFFFFLLYRGANQVIEVTNRRFLGQKCNQESLVCKGTFARGTELF